MTMYVVVRRFKREFVGLYSSFDAIPVYIVDDDFEYQIIAMEPAPGMPGKYDVLQVNISK